MKYLITGVAGFIGSSIADRLLNDGHEVIGIDCFTDYYDPAIKSNNIKNALDNKNFTLLKSDINQLPLNKILEDIEIIFHQSAQAGVRASWGDMFDSYVHHNILATQKILEACKAQPNIKKIVYASSSSVYGDAERYPTVETDLPKPRSPYGVTKLAGEHLMVLYAKQFNVPTVSLRYFTVFGPRQRPDMAFNRFIRAGLKNEPLTLYGSGEQIRDFTFISDIVEANIQASINGIPGAVYNIGGGTQASVNQVITFIESQIGKIAINRHSAQPGDVFKTCACCELAKKEINFQPSFTLEQGLIKEIEWVRSTL